MDLIQLIQPLLETGSLGIVLAVTLFKDYKITKKLFYVIENNTKALTELKDKIDPK